MRVLAPFLAGTFSSMAGCSTLPDPSCQARLERLRGDPSLSEERRAEKIERQIQICRAEQGDEAAEKWLRDH